MTLSVLVNGRVIPTYYHEGKKFIEGWKGSNYELNYLNGSLNHQKIVVSVDGLNVVSGDTNWEKGYVVNAGQVLIVPGWRKDSGNVAKFMFSSLRSSYNQHNEKGDSENIGVIGCKVFNEKVVFNNITNSWSIVVPYPRYPYPNYSPYSPYGPYWYPSYTLTSGNVGNGTVGLSGSSFSGGGVGISSSSVNMAHMGENAQASYTCDTDFSSMPQNSVGTGWGENKKFETTKVNYEFDSNPVETILFYYDDRKGLQRRGIKLDRHYQEYNEPNAFPGDNDGCPLPTNNWR